MSIHVPNDVWKIIVKYCNVPQLTIHTEYHYNGYYNTGFSGGSPITLYIKIHMNNSNIYIKQKIETCIPHYLELCYAVENLRFVYGSGPHDDRIFKFNDKKLNEYLDNIDFNDVLLFGIGHWKNYDNDEVVFAIGHTCINFDQLQITSFMKQYISVLREFQERCKQFMINHKKTINPENKQIGFYAPQKIE